MLGPLFIDIAGTTLTIEEREMLMHPLVGGIVLFSRNYVSPNQLTDLVKQIKSLRTPELIISVDHEGGRVQRFQDGFTRLPPMASLGEMFLADPIKATKDAAELGFVMASELRQHNIDLSFAPVLDLNRGICKVLEGGRALSPDVDTVVTLAAAYMTGMHKAGMPTVGKHFPGHGSVAVDSHVGIPHDKRPLVDVEQTDMQAFTQLFDKGLDAVMPAHIIFPEVDSLPVSLSPKWLQALLRIKYGFTGIIISDCLSMAGAAAILSEPTQRVQQALIAGCDAVLLCNDRQAQELVLDKLIYQPSLDVSQKLLELRRYQ